MICTEPKTFYSATSLLSCPALLHILHDHLLLLPRWMSDFWLLSDSNWRVAGGRENWPRCASTAASSEHLPESPGGGQPQQWPWHGNGYHNHYWWCQWQPTRMQSLCLQVWNLFLALVLPCCPRLACRFGHIPRPAAGGSRGHFSLAWPLDRAVVHQNTWVRFWVASSIVAYLDLGFHFKNKSKFWPVIYEEFKRRNISCFDRKCICF